MGHNDGHDSDDTPSSETNALYWKQLREQQPEQESLRHFARAIADLVRQEEPTAYERYIWAIAQDPMTFPERPDLRAALQALITMSSYTAPSIGDAVSEIQSELEALDDAEASECIFGIVNEEQGEAEETVFALSDHDERIITFFELGHRLHALRTNMLTEKEMESAIWQFGEERFLDALPEVKRLLVHALPGIRRRALETLIMHWQLPDCRDMAFQFLADPDPACRRQGMRCLNPSGKVVDDLGVLAAYAHVAANPDEEPGIRLSAYSELLMVAGYRIDDDCWQEIGEFLQDGAPLEQAPWIDWPLVHFFHAKESETCAFHVTLTFEGAGERQEWVDQHGRVFNTIEEVARDVFLRAHQLARTRFPNYTMAVSLRPKEK